MPDAALTNIQAFRPYDGGAGIRVSASGTTGSTAYRIPGLAGGTDGNENRRVLITNSRDSTGSAFVRMGPGTVTADTNSLEILPGDAYLLTPPTVNPSGVWFAVCTESDGAAKVSVCAGEGT